MARVTVEDCVDKVPSYFDLVVLAAKRVRQIWAGDNLTVERDNDKNTVVALREIAEGTVEPAHLKEKVIDSLRQNVKLDVQEQELTDSIDREEKGELTADTIEIGTNEMEIAQSMEDTDKKLEKELLAELSSTPEEKPVT